ISLCLTLFSIVFVCTIQAQEFNAKVQIMSEKIANVDKQVFLNMQKSITEFLNARKWTEDEYLPEEKIDLTILINLTNKLDEEGKLFNATMNIQAARPVYNSSYSTSLVRYIDRDVAFSF